MSITMEELAKLANVSQGAVSLVLNGKAKGQISQKKQDLILSLAKEYNYRMNMAAKVLRKQRQYAVGIVMPRCLNMFYASLVTLLQQKFSERGYMTLFAFFYGDDFEKVYNSLYERQVDGIISWEHSPLLLDGDIPSVVFCNDLNERIDSVTSSKRFCQCGFDFNAVYVSLFEHLYALGHRKIGFVGNTHESRCALLDRFLRNKGIYDGSAYFFHCKDDLNGNISLFEKILTAPERPSAIVTTNDETARQLISVGSYLGIQFPRDISIAGFMNLPCSQAMYPALTTFDSRNGDLADSMVEMLLSMIEKPDIPVEDTFIQPELILRTSCGQPA